MTRWGRDWHVRRPWLNTPDFCGAHAVPATDAASGIRQHWRLHFYSEARWPSQSQCSKRSFSFPLSTLLVKEGFLPSADGDGQAHDTWRWTDRTHSSLLDCDSHRDSQGGRGHRQSSRNTRVFLRQSGWVGFVGTRRRVPPGPRGRVWPAGLSRLVSWGGTEPHRPQQAGNLPAPCDKKWCLAGAPHLQEQLGKEDVWWGRAKPSQLYHIKAALHTEPHFQASGPAIGWGLASRQRGSKSCLSILLCIT